MQPKIIKFYLLSQVVIAWSHAIFDLKHLTKVGCEDGYLTCCIALLYDITTKPYHKLSFVFIQMTEGILAVIFLMSM